VRIADKQAETPQLALWGEPPELPTAPVARVRHSVRARRVAVRISAAGAVELVVPRGVTEAHARAFLESRAEWVRHHVERRRTNQAVPTAFPPTQITFAMTGEYWRVFQAGGTGRPRLRENGQVLELLGSGTGEQWRHCLRRWLVRRAEQVLRPLLQELADLHGFTFTTLRVRSQRTRWGSCSSRGVISLNLALLFQPLDVVRYLLCHELAHTRHMNHSARFWRCVQACEPRYRELDRALCQGWRTVPDWVRGQDA
jgi:predicted metal-dependent hydrolase